MKCTACGAEVTKDAIYCEKCGNKLDKKVNVLTKKGKTQKMIKNLGVLMVLFVVLAFSVMAIMSLPKKVKLEQYLNTNLEIVGKNGVGCIDTTNIFDYEAFLEDVTRGYENEEVDCSNMSESACILAFSNQTEAELEYEEEIEKIKSSVSWNYSVNGEPVDQIINLKNNDKVEINVSYYTGERKSELFNKKFYSGQKVIYVHDLEGEGELIDPFATENISVEFHGFDGEGSVTIKNHMNSNLNEMIDYTVVKLEDTIKNGNHIMVEIEYDALEFAKLGFGISQRSKEYEIQGLNTLVTSTEQIDKNVLQELIKSNLKEYGAETLLRKKAEYVGTYLTVSNDRENKYLKNALYIVIKSVYKDTSETFYNYIQYSNISMDTEKNYYTGHMFESGITDETYSSFSTYSSLDKLVNYISSDGWYECYEFEDVY